MSKPEAVKKPDLAQVNAQLRTQLKTASEENAGIREELQRVFTFANDRNVQIYSQAYFTAIAANHPDPDETATKCLNDLRKAFGMDTPH